ncbi:hypothetical protein DM47_2674 [Burkholderia mallei]|uniref:hypothetical protein n=1 Tax=Burkholderia pseudomallei TaxID=28450 RepID=UPI0006C4C235|nr:hypothetical protein [Burkholderia pseudomallei]KOS76896.1 hypothetical protein DM46_2427 [Burkholderia mallei]KOT02728.1 hypothetical protein DM50_3756 [Burkholderia mallei]KOT09286.1 hypothetical protein DM77_1831 [Burkholderia mallei]KOT21207.1 hypothetical protein DM47_2674 [Burkholderia mallei]
MSGERAEGRKPIAAQLDATRPTARAHRDFQTRDETEIAPAGWNARRARRIIAA